MKKLLITIFATLLLLFGCSTNDSSNEVSEDNNRQDQETQEAVQEETQVEIEQEENNEEEQPENIAIDENQVREIIEGYGLGEGDKILDLAIANNEIKVAIELAEGIFPLREMAISTYSSISDQLLNYDGWEVLTVEFKNVGTISMNKSQKETNELGLSYFPAIEIEKNLK